MGPKQSTQQQQQAQIESQENMNDDDPSAQGDPRDIRRNYIARVGVGPAANILQRYRNYTVQDFKPPQWLGPSQDEEDEADQQNLSIEPMAANDKYQLNFVQAKTNDEIRRQFLQKMSKMGYWLPPSQRPPTSQSIIIFDWDDTLLCTTFLNQREDSMNITSKTVKAQLSRLEDSVYNLLTLATKLGHTYIITNAMKGWVEYSSSLWIQKVVPVLENVKIISARSEYEHLYPGNYHQWKVQTFLEMTKQFDTGTITNLVCMGDSLIEIDAAHTLAKQILYSQYQNACIKTIKFRDCPNPEELVKQLELVTEKFEKICTAGRNLTIRLERQDICRKNSQSS